MFSLSYLVVFGSAFLAATIFPFYSEVVLIAVINEGGHAWLLWGVATLGNTLGSAVNWVLGRFLEHYQEHRWFPFKGKELAKAQRWFQRYGVWSLLLAWLPIGGDALTFIAGLMRVNFWQFFILTAIGKGARYAVLVVAIAPLF